MSSWLPYESLLRGILSTHPFNVDKVVSQGIPLKLTKSSIKVGISEGISGGCIETRSTM